MSPKNLSINLVTPISAIICLALTIQRPLATRSNERNKLFLNKV